MGDLILVRSGATFPADLVALASSEEEGVCYIDTTNLDGESGHKTRRAAPFTAPFWDVRLMHARIGSQHAFAPPAPVPAPHCRLALRAAAGGIVDCSIPSSSLHDFAGQVVLPPMPPELTRVMTLHEAARSHQPADATAPPPEAATDWEASVGSSSSALSVMPDFAATRGHTLEQGYTLHSLADEQLLLRGAVLRDTAWVLAAVTYVGVETKLMKNQRRTQSKFSRLEKQLNKFVIALMLLKTLLCILCALGGRFQDQLLEILGWHSKPLWVGDNPDTSTMMLTIERIVLDFFTFFILFSFMIPLSMYVGLEFAKVGQAWFIEWDARMRYVGEGGVERGAQCRTSSLNEELGQIEALFSDKTGTLTDNTMLFRACSVGGELCQTANDFVQLSQRAAAAQATLLACGPRAVPWRRRRQSGRKSLTSAQEGSEAAAIAAGVVTDAASGAAAHAAPDGSLAQAGAAAGAAAGGEAAAAAALGATPAAGRAGAMLVDEDEGVGNSGGSGRDDDEEVKHDAPSGAAGGPGGRCCASDALVRQFLRVLAVCNEVSPSLEADRRASNASLFSREELARRSADVLVMVDEKAGEEGEADGEARAFPPSPPISPRRVSTGARLAEGVFPPSVELVPMHSASPPLSVAGQEEGSMRGSVHGSVRGSVASVGTEGLSLELAAAAAVTAAADALELGEEAEHSVASSFPLGATAVHKSPVQPSVRRAHSMGSTGSFVRPTSARVSDGAAQAAARGVRLAVQAATQAATQGLGAERAAGVRRGGGGQVSAEGRHNNASDSHPSSATRSVIDNAGADAGAGAQMDAVARPALDTAAHTAKGAASDGAAEAAGAMPASTAQLEANARSVDVWLSLDSDDCTYRAESSDEVALVRAARALGQALVLRKPDLVVLQSRVLRPPPPGAVAGMELLSPQEVAAGSVRVGHANTFHVLACLRFTSDRKRMSMLVRTPEGELALYTKGADSMVLSLVEQSARGGAAPPDAELLRVTREHLSHFSRAGYRTLVMAWRPVSEREYRAWRGKWARAAAAVQDREGKEERAFGALERGLRLLGCTAVEDRLQEGVPTTVSMLLDAGIRVAMLTGDKTETAVSIAGTCGLVRQRTRVLELRASTPKQARASMRKLLRMVGGREALAAALLRECDAISRKRAMAREGPLMRMWRVIRESMFCVSRSAPTVTPPAFLNLFVRRDVGLQPAPSPASTVLAGAGAWAARQLSDLLSLGRRIGSPFSPAAPADAAQSQRAQGAQQQQQRASVGEKEEEQEAAAETAEKAEQMSEQQPGAQAPAAPASGVPAALANTGRDSVTSETAATPAANASLVAEPAPKTVATPAAGSEGALASDEAQAPLAAEPLTAPQAGLPKSPADIAAASSASAGPAPTAVSHAITPAPSTAAAAATGPAAPAPTTSAAAVVRPASIAPTLALAKPEPGDADDVLPELEAKLGTAPGHRPRRPSFVERVRDVFTALSPTSPPQLPGPRGVSAQSALTLASPPQPAEEPEFAFVVDGATAQLCLQHGEQLFAELYSRCRAAICCRMTPKQKSDMVRMAKSELGLVTMAIGDGANGGWCAAALAPARTSQRGALVRQM